jgi:hypothetical protein
MIFPSQRVAAVSKRNEQYLSWEPVLHPINQTGRHTHGTAFISPISHSVVPSYRSGQNFRNKQQSTCNRPLSTRGESVNRSQMDIKRKIYDIRTWGKKKLFFSAYPPPTLTHLSHPLYQFVETRGIETFSDCCLSHFRFNLFVIRETFATQL